MKFSLVFFNYDSTTYKIDSQKCYVYKYFLYLSRHGLNNVYKC